MTFSRRNFLLSLSLALPAGLALTSPRKLFAGETKWRGKWKGQYSYKTLPFDEALEIVFDPKAPRVFKGSAAHRVHYETGKLLDEFMRILRSGQASKQMKRLTEISVLAPAGIQALVVWSAQSEEGKVQAPVLLNDLVSRLQG